ncbi:glycosyltransferase family 4 protein [Aeoliella sp. ICT_H6.2]|uniref:Glycosyltransferase family 4 protein n=1 Tax=Aeoliella straminimaris TaxID=2954799 RepID=A0A9X2JHH0_9BACT|nr:glycosyltransferase family 4 protein [Aeoliella straminimaris]MCO6045447.1 glycosyltransferase family 4 protein [Aeoliella straminimaris]
MRILTIGAKSTINNALAACGNVEVWSMSMGADQPAEPVNCLPYKRKGKIHWEPICQVREAIRQARPDVIHAFYPRPLAHAVLATQSLGRRVPIVSFRGVTSQIKRWSPDQWITYLSPRVTAHACESGAVRDSLVAAGVPSERCHVVYNCLGGVGTVPLSRDLARRELDLADDALVVKMVANMRPVKGADVLLKAAMECSDLPNIKFVLMGRVLDSKIEQLASDPRLQGRVNLTGFQPRAARLLAAADVFVMPSRAEALCVAVLEAMTAGVCPVVSDAGGLKEAVRAGQDGIVFPNGDVGALAEVLRLLHADRTLLARYGASAQDRALRQFSSDAVAARLLQIYQQMCGGRQPMAA